MWVPGPVIVGAGPSGLAVAACLKEKGLPFLILEKQSCLASLWKLNTYDCLQLHLPKDLCQLPLMPFPQHFPIYPQKQQFISYLEAYAKHFSIDPLFGVEIRQAKYDAKMGCWRVEASSIEFLCRWLIIATGENSEPIFPKIEGLEKFSGKVVHTSEYKNGAEFKGNKVLVVGCGNSGMEIGLDLYNSGAHVSLVVRNKLHILPREVLGRSTFGLSTWLLKWLPVKLVDRLLILCSWMTLGNTHKFGIKRPEIGPLQLKKITGKTPVLDVGAICKIKSGDIKVVPGITKFTTRGAEFVDGKVGEFDSVILATGYRSNISSWLKEENLSGPEDGFPENPFPKNWKGKKGAFSVGFTRNGLLGISTDAQRVAQDISTEWPNEMRHFKDLTSISLF